MNAILALQQLDLSAIAARLVQDVHALGRLADLGVHVAAAWWVWRG